MQLNPFKILRTLLLFVHKYVHHPEKLPEIFVADKFFIFNEEIHDYNTRNKSNMHIYYSKNSAGLRTIRHKAAVLWNELPERSILRQCLKIN